MKTKLLKKLRRRGRNKVTLNSITKTNGLITGMSYSFDEEMYSGLFDFGMSFEDVQELACRIYIQDYLKNKRR